MKFPPCNECGNPMEPDLYDKTWECEGCCLLESFADLNDRLGSEYLRAYLRSRSNKSWLMIWRDEEMVLQEVVLCPVCEANDPLCLGCEGSGVVNIVKEKGRTFD